MPKVAITEAFDLIHTLAGLRPVALADLQYTYSDIFT